MCWLALGLLLVFWDVPILFSQGDMKSGDITTIKVGSHIIACTPIGGEKVSSCILTDENKVIVTNPRCYCICGNRKQLIDRDKCKEEK